MPFSFSSHAFPSFLLLLLAASPSVLGWGGTGHQLTGAIAMKLASQSTIDTLSQFIPDMQGDLSQASTWADQVKFTRKYAFTRNYHFIDANDNPPDDCSVDQARDCPGGKCLTGAIANYTTRMSCRYSAEDRGDAVKFVMHFLGDLTQPLHNCARLRGGNDAHVVFSSSGSGGHSRKKPPTHGGSNQSPAASSLVRRSRIADAHDLSSKSSKLNLHSIWDTTMIEKHMRENNGNSFDSLLQELMTAVQSAQQSGQAADWTACINGKTNGLDCAVAWAQDSDGLNCQMVWGLYDKDPTQDLSGEYYNQAWPIIQQQLVKAGVRAAAWFDTYLKAC